MRRERRIAVLLVFIGLMGRAAEAAHHPLDGASLTITRSRVGAMKLTFVAKDPAFLFPALGSADDPGTGTPGGLTLEIASAAQPSAVTIVAPPGTGTPGWRSTDGARAAHAYKNPGAGPGPLPVQTVVLKQGSRIKVVARYVPLDLLGPQGIVGVRLTTGMLQNCALFDAATIRRDEADRFKATGSVASALTDCLHLLPPPPTTTSSSTTTTTSLTTSTTIVFASCGAYPTCGGSCAPGDTCLEMFDFVAPSPFRCNCIPPDVEPCRIDDYPTCNGQCPDGGVCQALYQGAGLCACVSPTVTCGSPGGPGTCEAGVCPGGVCLSVGPPIDLCGCSAFP